MRQLKLQVQISVDGYVAGPNGEMDWMTWNMDDKLKQYINTITDLSDTILLGRKMTDGFVSHWTSLLSKPKDPSYAFAKKMVDTPKVVFSKTLEKSTWANTTLAKGNLVDEITKLKKQDGKDIVVYGGASFVSNLIAQNLIDTLHLFVNPAAIGNGMKIFTGKTMLSLEKSIQFECGINVSIYKPRRDK
jgi:dihydrofolate reductase